jgi:hypothetical protein
LELEPVLADAIHQTPGFPQRLFRIGNRRCIGNTRLMPVGTDPNVYCAPTSHAMGYAHNFNDSTTLMVTNYRKIGVT